MLKSKDVLIIAMGVILSGVIAIFLNSFGGFDNFRFDSFGLLWAVILILFLIVILSVSILYMRIRESEVDLLNQATEQKQLGEKLKIYKILNKLESEVENLKNEKRK